MTRPSHTHSLKTCRPHCPVWDAGLARDRRQLYWMRHRIEQVWEDWCWDDVFRLSELEAFQRLHPNRKPAW